MISLGSVYPAAVNVFDASGNPANATTVTLTITLPDGTTATPAVTNPPAVTGQYSFPYLTTEPGRHVVRWVTANPNTAYTDVFDVTDPGGLGIVSLADTKRQLGIDPAETEDDDELLSWIVAMTGPVERAKNEIIVKRQFTYTEPCRHAWKFRLRYLPVVSLDTLTGSVWGTVTTYTPANYTIDPDTGIGRQTMPGISLAGELTFTQTAGYQVMPPYIINACMMLIQALWETRRGPGGVGGVIGPEELGDYRHYEALPRKVRGLLGAPRPVVF